MRLPKYESIPTISKDFPMPNLGNVLKDEVVRLCRKELRKELGPVRKITTAHRRDLAALKRQLAEAQRRVQLLERQAARAGAARPQPSTDKPVRFVAKGLRSLRQRLGLSAADLARLIEVSEQSVYNWESKKTTPRREQVQALAALRGIGKREVRAQLERMPK
jgi:DNA-binding transcriptional regulator YiaG